MEDKKEIEELLKLISHLKHRQWEIVKTVVDIAFNEKVKNETISFNEKSTKIICDDLIQNGL